ncbi:hypothetical protein NQ317_017971 [Molorchus minor]|uniref:Uncharacterized protein n=1 Tax=Molorchus minor TaxID=1323400 RepID=A0ABQ9JLN1_9CUCU|nr:hypothetical protein NQ317_017971 [Molorchus minor]
MGNIEITQDPINRILPKNNQSGVNQTKLLESTDKLLITAGNTVEESDRNTENKLRSDTLVEHQINKECQLENKEKLKPLDLRPNLMADLSEITKPGRTFAACWGCKSFLQNMKQHDCTPDIKTFTQLLDSIPNTDAAENELLGSMKKLKIKPDVDFYNMLKKKGV